MGVGGRARAGARRRAGPWWAAGRRRRRGRGRRGPQREDAGGRLRRGRGRRGARRHGGVSGGAVTARQQGDLRRGRRWRSGSAARRARRRRRPPGRARAGRAAARAAGAARRPRPRPPSTTAARERGLRGQQGRGALGDPVEQRLAVVVGQGDDRQARPAGAARPPAPRRRRGSGSRRGRAGRSSRPAAPGRRRAASRASPASSVGVPGQRRDGGAVGREQLGEHREAGPAEEQGGVVRLGAAGRRPASRAAGRTRREQQRGPRRLGRRVDHLGEQPLLRVVGERAAADRRHGDACAASAPPAPARRRPRTTARPAPARRRPVRAARPTSSSAVRSTTPGACAGRAALAPHQRRGPGRRARGPRRRPPRPTRAGTGRRAHRRPPRCASPRSPYGSSRGQPVRERGRRAWP